MTARSTTSSNSLTSVLVLLAMQIMNRLQHRNNAIVLQLLGHLLLPAKARPANPMPQSKHDCSFKTSLSWLRHHHVDQIFLTSRPECRMACAFIGQWPTGRGVCICALVRLTFCNISFCWRLLNVRSFPDWVNGEDKSFHTKTQDGILPVLQRCPRWQSALSFASIEAVPQFCLSCGSLFWLRSWQVDAEEHVFVTSTVIFQTQRANIIPDEHLTPYSLALTHVNWALLNSCEFNCGRGFDREKRREKQGEKRKGKGQGQDGQRRKTLHTTTKRQQDRHKSRTTIHVSQSYIYTCKAIIEIASKQSQTRSNHPDGRNKKLITTYHHLINIDWLNRTKNKTKKNKAWMTTRTKQKTACRHVQPTRTANNEHSTHRTQRSQETQHTQGAARRRRATT